MSDVRPHALVLSTSLPPFVDAQTIRNVFLLRGLVTAGFRVTGITAGAEGAGDASLSGLLPREILIHATAPARYHRWQSALRRRGLTRIEWLSGVLSHFFLVPDPWVGWDRACVHAAAGLGIRPDVVISTSASVTAHLAAAELSRRWQAPWVADYGDPWTLNPIWPSNAWYRRPLNARLERRALKAAAAVTFTTAETREAYRAWLGEAMPPAFVVPCGLTLAEVAPPPTGDVYTIAYVGTAHRLTRNLDAAIQAVARLNATSGPAATWRLRIVGPHSAAFERAAADLGTDAVVFGGRVSFADSIREMQAAHALLLIGNTGGLQVPSKAFMYLATGRPIVYLAQERPELDPTARLVSRFAGVHLSSMAVDDLASVLAGLRADRGAADAAARSRLGDPALRAYEWERIAEAFAEIVRGALSGTSTALDAPHA